MIQKVITLSKQCLIFYCCSFHCSSGRGTYMLKTAQYLQSVTEVGQKVYKTKEGNLIKGHVEILKINKNT